MNIFTEKIKEAEHEARIAYVGSEKYYLSATELQIWKEAEAMCEKAMKEKDEQHEAEMKKFIDKLIKKLDTKIITDMQGNPLPQCVIIWEIKKDIQELANQSQESKGDDGDSSPKASIRRIAPICKPETLPDARKGKEKM